MDAFNLQVSPMYQSCGVKNCTCCTLAHNSKSKKMARKLARKRLATNKFYKEEEK